MMLQPGSQTITMHMLPNILRSKHNQTLKLGQLIEYKKRNIFFKNYAKIEARKLVPDLFLFFKKLNLR